jgi:hypothetical protein
MVITDIAHIPGLTANLQRPWKPLYVKPATKNKLFYKQKGKKRKEL